MNDEELDFDGNKIPKKNPLLDDEDPELAAETDVMEGEEAFDSEDEEEDDM